LEFVLTADIKGKAMKQYKAVLLAAVVLFLVQASSEAQDSPKYKELPNFHVVNENLFRGGQPKDGGLEKLKQLGVKTIIDLRNDHAEAEGAEARAAGMQYFNFPMARFGRPDDKTIEEVLKIIRANENHPVFVHCAKGSDRTGTILAIYRIEYDGWTSEKAKAEANRYGMGAWQVQMKDYIRDYYTRKSKQQAGQVPK
jgi:tyrosine-protein phosphatase SIW14